MNDVLISIKPKFVKRIFTNEPPIKRWEIRKKIPKQNYDKMFVYSSAPTKKIIGFIKIKRIDRGTPDAIWNKPYNKELGVSKKEYWDYVGDKEIFALNIRSVFKFIEPIDPDEIEGWSAPQNFRYLKDSEKDLFLNMKTDTIWCEDNE